MGVASGTRSSRRASTRRLVSAFVKHAAATAPLARAIGGITEREREVLTLVGLGMSNAEIAEQAGRPRPGTPGHRRL